jgi:hypothetical protein
VPTWKKSQPKPNSYKCDHYLHLWRYGLSLAIYDLVGTITNGGQTEFYGKISNLSRYFDSNAEATRRAFRRLVNDGWLEATTQKGYYNFVKHDTRAFSKSDCAEREVAHWSADADPFVGKLHAAASGKLRVQPHWIAAARKVADDQEFLHAFKENLTKKSASAGTAFWQTVREFRPRKNVA